MCPNANAAIPPSTGSGSGINFCRTPPLKQSPIAPRVIPAANSPQDPAAGDRLNPRNQIQPAATNRAEEPKCETNRIWSFPKATVPKEIVPLRTNSQSNVPPSRRHAQRIQIPTTSPSTVADLSSPGGNRVGGRGAAFDAAFDGATVISLPGDVGASDIEFPSATHRGPRGTIVRQADRLSNGGRPLATDFSQPSFPSHGPTRKRQRVTGTTAPPFASEAHPKPAGVRPAFGGRELRRHRPSVLA